MNRYGIDLGADHIRLIAEDATVLFDEPTMIALDKKNRVLAIGYEANNLKSMADPSIRIVSPLLDSQISFELLQLLLDHICYQCKVFRVFSKTELIFSYPTYLSKEQVEELKNYLMELGASRVYCDQEIWISAIGANLDLFLPVASCVLNIGSSNCDIALFSSGAMQNKSVCKYAGKHINGMIGNWLRNEYNLIVSSYMKQKIKETLASVELSSYPKKMQVQGVDAKTRQMKVVVIDENQVATILQPLLREWDSWLYQFISTLTKEQQDDIRMRGIVCCGGTMRLKGLQKHFQNVLQCPFFVTDDPLNTVTQGLEILLSRME